MTSAIFPDRSHRNAAKLRLLTGLAIHLYIPVATNDRLGCSHPETSMNFIMQPWQLMLIILAGWINRQQRQRIDYLETIVTVLKQHNGKKRILLTDDVDWQSKANSLAENNSSRLEPCSRRTQSCVGIDNWSPINGTTLTEKRRNQVGKGPDK
jgi:hypothetical protein